MGIRKGTPCPPELAKRPANLPTSPPPPRVDGKPDITLKIFRDGANAIYIRGFATVQQAVDAGNQWADRLWWRVTQDGKIVTEEPMRKAK